MQNDPVTEWTRLTRLYAEKSDEELLELAEEFGNLTEVAQGVLRDEMKKRGLEAVPPLGEAVSSKSTETASMAGFEKSGVIFGRWNQAVAEQNREFEPEEVLGGSDEENQIEYTWKTLLCECEEREQAWQIAEVLRRAGIESWMEGPHSQNSLDVRRPKVIVAADQLDQARAILEKPIPQDVIDQSHVKVEDFESPVCTKCGSEDPLLESVEPANTWLCENCGARWSDQTAVENEGRNPPK
jgi:hypothetical protein